MYAFIVTGLILGLTSNFHCVGMCGPIAMAIPVNRTNNITILSGSLQYNFGRLFTYFILGLVVGTIGLTINTLGILQWLSILTGIGLILYAWRKFFAKWSMHIMPIGGIQRFLNKGLGKILQSKSPFKLVLLGGLNGLLPCGMVFAGLLNAILAGNMIGSGLAMIAFGIGTLPSMIAVTFMANKISGTVRKKMSAAVPYLLTLVGALVILRGMNLDIPYISPKLSVTKIEQTIDTSTDTLEMSCCHSSEDCE